MPPDLADTLDRDPDARRALDAVSSSGKQRLVLAVEQVKTAETGAARRQGGRGAAGGPRPIEGERALPSLSRRG